MTLTGMLAAGGIAYGAICLLMYVFQERLLFLPDAPGRAVTATPAALGLAYEELGIVAADGERLHGWWIPAPRARFTVLHFHGNAGNIGHRLEHVQLLHGLGLNMLLFDYRGYGRSSGTASEAGLYRDAEAVWEHAVATRGVPAASVVLHGQSMGGAVAAWLAARREPAALVVESAFTSVPELAGQLYPWLPGRWMTHLKLDTRAAVARARCPVLVIHSREDEIIPFAHGEALYAAATGRKALLALGGSHNDGFWLGREAYAASWRDFLAALPGPEAAADR
jgi:uncharacterized protein